MKKILMLICLTVLSATVTFAQEQELTAHFTSKTPLVMNDKGQGTASFGLSATPEQMGDMNEAISASPQKYEFRYEAVKGKPYDYACRLTLLQDQGIKYLHKTLLSLNVLYFTYLGETYAIDKMLTMFE